MTDVAGNADYSRTIAIRLGSSASFEVFPNPAKNSLYVQWTLSAAFPGSVSLRIVDAAGKIVRTMSIPATGSVLSTQIDISNLQKGLYYIFAGEETRSFLKQ
jgi:type IX secretion system substrate protein